MGRTKSKKDKTELRFIQKYQRVFSEWWNNILDTEPTYIVPITRKAPRMLELFNKYGNGNLGEDIYKMGWIISEKAIPFLSNDEIRGSTFAVMDDILIYGSTLKTVVENIKKREPKDISCFTFTYDVEGEKVPGLDKYEIQYKLPTTEEENAVFSNELASSFSLLAKPYDVDHPIFYLKLRDYYLSEERLESKFKKISNFVFNATPLRQREHGICSFSCVFSDGDFLKYIFKNQKEIDFEMSKIRTYSNLNTGDIALLSIYLFSMSVETLKQISFNGNLSFLNDILRKTNERLHENGYEDKDLEIGMIRVCTFLVEYLYGRYFILKLKSEKLFDESASIEPPHFINDFDMRLLFGKSFSSEILSVLGSEKEKIDSYLREIIQKRKHLNNLQEYHTESNVLTNQHLRNELFLTDKYQDIRNILFKHKDNEDVVYNLWSIFRLMHEKNIKEIEENVDVLDRLNYGFSFSDIYNILTVELNCQVDRIVVSTALDYLIDRGAAVPRFVRNNGSVGRVFRFGESINIYGLALIFRKTLESFVNKFSKKYVNKFMFEKLLTLVGGILENKENYRYENFRLYYDFDKEGARLKVIEREKYEAPFWLDQFCQTHSIIDKPGYVGEKEGKKIYLNEDFYRKNKRKTPVVPDEALMTFSNIGRFMWDICFKTELGKKLGYKQILLAFTTCNNEKYFLRAIKKDIELLFNTVDIAVNNLWEVLSESRRILKLEDIMGASSESNLPYAHERETHQKYIKEAYKLCEIIDEKYQVFRALKKIKKELDTIYSTANPDKIDLEPVWKYYRGFINPPQKDGNAYAKMEMLKKLAEQYAHLIDSVHDYIKSLSKDSTKILQDIKEYNSLVNKNKEISYLAFQGDDLDIFHKGAKEEDILRMVTDQATRLQLVYELLTSEHITKRKKGYYDYIKERGDLYDINDIPGALDNRIFVGGDYNVMKPILREICELIYSLNLQPIFALDFNIPSEEMKEQCVRLVSNCRYVILEMTPGTPGYGHAQEYEHAQRNNSKILIVAHRNPGALITTDRYSYKDVEHYETMDNLRGVISKWLTEKVLKDLLPT